MEYVKLPSYTEWALDNEELFTEETEMYFPVERILKPSKYPSWTFVTELFRYSVRLPEEFAESIKRYSRRKRGDSSADCELLRLGVSIFDKKAQLTALARTNDALTKEQIASGEWGIVIDCGSWYAIDYGREKEAYVNSSPFDETFSSVFFPSGGVSGSLGNASTTPKKTRKRLL